MVKVLTASIATAILALTSQASAAGKEGHAPEVVRSGPGQATGSERVTIRVAVVAVDAANRLITVRTAKGRDVTYNVSPVVERLGEIKAGDSIALTYERGVLFQYQPAGEKDAEPSLTTTAARGGADQPPTGTAASQIRATVKIVGVDRKHRLVFVEGPGGRLHEVKAGPDLKIERLKPGMRFFTVYSESLAVGVEPAAAKGAK